MNSTLHIYRSDLGTPDFLKSGYGYNIKNGLRHARNGKLLSFYNPYARGRAADTAASFTLQGLDYAGNAVVNYSLNTNLIDTFYNGTSSIFYYIGDTEILDGIKEYEQGIYRFNIVMSDGYTYLSEPFRIHSSKTSTVPGVPVGDFDSSDFDSTDFFTG